MKHLTAEQIFKARLILLNVSLQYTHLEEANLIGVHLEKTDLTGAHLEKAHLINTHLERARLWWAHLEEANLIGVHLEKANLMEAHLEEANLMGAHLEEARLWGAHLERALFREASFSHTRLSKVVLTDDAQSVGPLLADVQWGETNLSVVDWSQIHMLGDEHCAHQRVTVDGKKKDRTAWRQEYKDAHRATHQLAMVLRDQGLLDDASRFAYRAACLQRSALWYDLLLAKTIQYRIQSSWSWLFSWTLFLLAGYGYRLRRCLFWYIGIVLTFTFLYWWIDPVHLPWWVALGESVNVFHGRGTTPNITELAHPARFLVSTVVEAIVGLVIEVIFVATMVQRLFGK
jgi:Pentapeptide repeats (8 copies)